MAETITCTSGNKYEWTRPPRHVHGRHGRTGQTFFNKVREIAEGDPENELSAQERGMRLLESLSERDAAALQRYMDDVIRAGLGRAPEDVPEPDYWELFGRSVYSVKETKVETTEGDTTAAAVETFRAQPGVPADGEDVPDVRTAPVEGDGAPAPAAV
jgi:peptidoglycan hydrolase-like protein with peptidoglycan-binding domain